MSQLKNKVISSVGLLSVAKLVTQLVTWSSTLIVIRYLTPEDYAIVALAMGLWGVFEIFSSLGLGAIVVQRQKIERIDLQRIFGLLLLINGALCAILFFSAGWLAEFYKEPDLDLVFKLVAFSFFFIAIESIPANLLIKEMQFKQVAIAEIAGGFTGAVVAIVMAVYGYGYWAIIISGMVVHSVRIIIKLFFKPINFLPVLHFSESKQYLNFGMYVMGASFAWYLYVTLDVIIAGRYWSKEELGVYAVALQLAVLPLNKIMPVIKQVAFSGYSATQDDMQRVTQYFSKSMGLAMGLSFPLFFGIAAVAPLIIYGLAGAKWAAAILPLTFLSLVMPFRMMLELFEPALIGIGKPKLVFINQMVILAVMIPVFLYSIWNYHSTGLSLSWLVVFPILSFVIAFFYSKWLNVGYGLLLSKILPSCFYAIVMFAAVRFVCEKPFAQESPLIWLAATIVLGAIVYVGLLKLFSPQAFGEYLGLVKKKRA